MFGHFATSCMKGLRGALSKLPGKVSTFSRNIFWRQNTIYFKFREMNCVLRKETYFLAKK